MLETQTEIIKHPQTLQHPIPPQSPQIHCLCPKTQLEAPGFLQQCSICNLYQHKSCIRPLISINNEKEDHNIYICPFCLFTHLDPYLAAHNSISNPKFIIGKFTRFKMPHQIEDNAFIIIRCLYLSEVKLIQSWPFCKVKLNNSLLLDYGPTDNRIPGPIIIYTSKSQLPEHIKQYTHPTVTSSSMRCEPVVKIFVPDSTLSLEVSGTSNVYYKYIISIDIVTWNNPDDVITQTQIIHDIDTLRKLTQIEGTDCLATKERIDMLDCFTSADLIEKPSRGWFCTHLSVFDLEKWVKGNITKARKTCPICSKLVWKVYVDGFIYERMKRDKEMNVNIRYYDLESDYSKMEGIDEKCLGIKRERKEESGKEVNEDDEDVTEGEEIEDDEVICISSSDSDEEEKECDNGNSNSNGSKGVISGKKDNNKGKDVWNRGVIRTKIIRSKNESSTIICNGNNSEENSNSNSNNVFMGDTLEEYLKFLNGLNFENRGFLVNFFSRDSD